MVPRDGGGCFDGPAKGLAHLLVTGSLRTLTCILHSPHQAVSRLEWAVNSAEQPPDPKRYEG
jgi:hypothetical protein